MSAFFAGFDTVSYPGDDVMKSLWLHTNLYWCGFYLGPHYDWTPHFRTMKSIGWGVAPIYMGKQPGSAKLLAIRNRHLGRAADMTRALYDNGREDGREAIQYARAAGVPAATVIYFDAETSNDDLGWVTYYRGWSRAVVESGYSVGLYTRPDFARWIMAKLMRGAGFDIVLPYIWIAKYKIFNPDPKKVPEWAFLKDPYPEYDPRKSWSGATSWQFGGNCGFHWVEKAIPGKPRKRSFSPVDPCVSLYRDPGLGVMSAVVFGA